MRIFLAGIMQGSHHGPAMHDQGYRTRLRELVERHLPGVEVYDPWAEHQNSLDYADDEARRVFFGHNRLCGQVEAVLAFVPEASMGTAIEMWEAHQAGRLVITVSPLVHNWAVRFLSRVVYPTWDEFERALVSGEVGRLLAEHSRGGVVPIE